MRQYELSFAFEFQYCWVSLSLSIEQGQGFAWGATMVPGDGHIKDCLGLNETDVWRKFEGEEISFKFIEKRVWESRNEEGWNNHWVLRKRDDGLK